MNVGWAISNVSLKGIFGRSGISIVDERKKERASKSWSCPREVWEHE